VAFRKAAREKNSGWFNAPVPSFGPIDAQLLIVGLAPGLKGANRTGRPFTGDYAGILLYRTLIDFGFARGRYDPNGNDDLEMIDARITNAARCVPPENKPTPEEVATCRPFLMAAINEMTQLQAFMVLGRIAHDTLLRTFELKLKNYPFKHGVVHKLPDGRLLFDSYHCSRYNTQTGCLTENMFKSVFKEIRQRIKNRRASNFA
jgi:uracil-DNA glycosylase family 4